MVQRVLTIGYGNPGRLDDGLGPAMAEMLEALALPGVTVDADYQLTVEDAAAVAQHDAVVFMDAAVTGPEPFSFQRVVPDDRSAVTWSSHSLEPAMLMALARDLFGAGAEGFVLAVRGYEFDDFGERLCDRARDNLAAALQFLVPVLRDRRLGAVADASSARPAVPPV